MQRGNLVYILIAAFLFVCFISFLETKKANASLSLEHPENPWIMGHWVIAEVHEQESRRDVTEKFSAEVWQFLNSSGFVRFRNRTIENTGEWDYRNGIISIRKDGEEDEFSYKLEKSSRNEIILSSEELKFRLLKLDNI